MLARERNCAHLSIERAVALALRAARRDCAPAKRTKRRGGEDGGGSGEGEEAQEEQEQAEEEAAEEDEEESGGDDDEAPKADPDELYVQPVASELARRAWALASQGQAVDAALGLALLDELARLDAVQFHGYVLEGLPMTPEHAALVASWPYPPDVAIWLQASEEDIASRWQGARIDPASGRVHVPGDLAPPALPAPPADEAEAEAEANENDEEEDAAAAAPVVVAEPQLPPVHPLPADTLSRLVPAPAETLAHLAARSRSYNEAQDLIFLRSSRLQVQEPEIEKQKEKKECCPFILFTLVVVVVLLLLLLSLLLVLVLVSAGDGGRDAGKT